jgi:hypothetical protein
MIKCFNGFCKFIGFKPEPPPSTVSKSKPAAVKQVEVRPTKYLLDKPTYIDNDKLRRIESYKKSQETELTRLEAQKDKKNSRLKNRLKRNFPNFFKKSLKITNLPPPPKVIRKNM